MSYAENLAAAIAAQFEHLGEPMTFRPLVGDAVEVQAIYRRPSEALSMGQTEFVRPRPTIHVPLASAPVVRAGDLWERAGRLWAVAGAPTRPGHGHIWLCEVEDRGPA